MSFIYSLAKIDYLQRTRSYAFLITLAVTIYMAYSFIPPDDASYTTLNAPGYKSVYNAAFAGYLSALMTTVMLSLYGFLLVNNSIKKDIDTEVGLIIATTPVTNFNYLLSKMISNFLVLCTIVGCTFMVTVMVFFIRGSAYPFVFTDFLLPYLFFPLPVMFMVSALAIAAEVFFRKHGILQFIIYFLLWGLVIPLVNVKSGNHPSGIFDPFGLSLISSSITNHINAHFNANLQQVSFGFLFSAKKAAQLFVWNGINWTGIFIMSRFMWMGMALGLVYCASFFFHRFDFKINAAKKKKQPKVVVETAALMSAGGINRTLMPPPVIDYSIFPFIKTELLLMIRLGNKWLWLLNAGLWVVMIFVPLHIAYSYLLPVLLFLQVRRWSELTTREKTHRIHYFTYASYKPLLRMLPAQILAGIVFGIALAIPVIVRSALLSDGMAVLHIFNGIVLVILLATTLGIVSGSNKLYEVLFFLLTYCVLNLLPVTDYLGSLRHEHHLMQVLLIAGINVTLMVTGFVVRNYQTRHL